MTQSPLAQFSAAARTWFVESFESPTPVQTQAWQQISAGNHALVVAPTGSGKTLAAFFWALDRLISRPATEIEPRTTKVIYVSPLKALGVDVERNLRAPLAGITRVADRLGEPHAQIRVGVRSGDTTSSERAALVRRPPEILITTPESLYLMLTSAAKRTLADVDTVIVDEIHAVAGTKRGTHLALSLERLDALVGRDVQRVALSATVKPIDRVASFLGGDRPVQIVAPSASKDWQVSVKLPVPDITDLPMLETETDPLLADSPVEGLSSTTPSNQTLWPHVEREIYAEVMAGRSTLVFCNSRRASERLTAKLNELWALEHDPESLASNARRPPAEIMPPTDEVGHAPAVIARSHHGSVSKEARLEIENALKSGELKCVVATSSLELGIDMGAVDRVIQVSAPPSVASALQRIGRAGHNVGATSVGDCFPLFRADLIPSAVAVESLLAGEIESLQVPRAPLDVLAQQTVAAAVAAGDAGLGIADWFAQCQRSAPYAALDYAAYESVLELLTGRYPSADFGELRARLEQRDDRLHALPGSLHLATTSGGTIPDRGMFGVFLATEEAGARRVGELDEEMVFESRVGDTFTLGASSWRILEINRDQVIVTPAPGHTGRLPFWRGESEGRPAEFGAAIGQFSRQALANPERLQLPFLDENTRTNITNLLTEQQEATGTIPDDRTIVLERFLDEVGDWRFVLHSPLGRPVLSAWATAISAVVTQRSGHEISAVAGDDAIVWRLPDSDLAEQMAEVIAIDPAELEPLVTNAVGATALFAGRFRECAARALLLPRRDPKRRRPLWQQRQRAQQLLEVARLHPRFPIILETVREVLTDVYDLAGLTDLLTKLARGTVRLASVTTANPSPLAAATLYRYTGAFLYNEDAPLAERRMATLSLDPQLLAAVLGTIDLRELLDPSVVSKVAAQLQLENHPAATAPQLADRLRRLGPIPTDNLSKHATRAVFTELGEDLTGLQPEVWQVRIAGTAHLAAAADLALLRDALGVPLPAGASAGWVEDSERDPLAQLLGRFARSHVPFTAAQAASVFGLGVATAALVLDREASAGRLVVGHFTPDETENEYCDKDVLSQLRSRSLAKARSEVAPVAQRTYARFLTDWHQVSDPLPSSPDEVLGVVSQLAGTYLPASVWESQIFPSRLTGYRSSDLDQLLAEGEVIVRISGAHAGNDPNVALLPAAEAGLVPTPKQDEALVELADLIATTDGHYLSIKAACEQAGESATQLAERLWAAAEAGLIAPASLAPVRARLSGLTGKPPRSRRQPNRARMRLPRNAGLLRPDSGATVPPSVVGRWYRVQPAATNPAEAALAQTGAWLTKYGIATRGALSLEQLPGGFAAAYRILRDLEAAGKLLRGYLVEGLGGSQFATTQTIDQLRDYSTASDPLTAAPVVLSAIDPANPYGAALDWPEVPGPKPSRSAGALVVIADGELLAYLSRGGRSISLLVPTDSDQQDTLTYVTKALVAAADDGRLSKVSIEECNGERLGELGQVMRSAGAKLTPKGVVIGSAHA